MRKNVLSAYSSAKKYKHQTSFFHSYDHKCIATFFMNHSVVTAQDYEWELKYTRAVQPVATRRQSPYLHKPAIVKLLLLI